MAFREYLPDRRRHPDIIKRGRDVLNIIWKIQLDDVRQRNVPGVGVIVAQGDRLVIITVYNNGNL